LEKLHAETIPKKTQTLTQEAKPIKRGAIDDILMNEILSRRMLKGTSSKPIDNESSSQEVLVKLRSSKPKSLYSTQNTEASALFLSQIQRKLKNDRKRTLGEYQQFRYGEEGDDSFDSSQGS
jgi:hypothetical protein